MKKAKLLLVSLSALLTLAGCQKAGETSSTPSSEQESVTSVTASPSSVEATKYSITVENVTGVTVQVQANAEKGQTVTLTLTYDEEEYAITKVLANEIVCTNLGNKQYSFTMPEANVTIHVTAEKLPEKLSIINGNEGCVTLTDLPASINEGDSITFGYKLVSGYELTGSVKIMAGEDEVTFTNNNDGTYTFVMPSSSVTITLETKNKLYLITKDENTKSLINIIKCNYSLVWAKEYNEDATGEEEQDIWSHSNKAEYKKAVTVTLKSSATAKPTGIVIPEMDNKAILLEEGSDKVSFVMPNKNITIQVTSEMRYQSISFNNSDHLTMALYEKNGDTYTQVNKVVAGAKNYLKVTSSSEDYAAKTVSYTYTPATYGNDITNELTIGTDGYYEMTIPEIKDGTSLSFSVTEKQLGTFSKYSFVGSYFGTMIKAGEHDEVSWSAMNKTTIDDSGAFTINSNKYQVTEATALDKGIAKAKDSSGQVFSFYFDGNVILADSSFSKNTFVANDMYIAFKNKEDTPSYVRDLYRGYVDETLISGSNYLIVFTLNKKAEQSNFSDSTVLNTFVFDVSKGTYILDGVTMEYTTNHTKPTDFISAMVSYNILVDGKVKYRLEQTGNYSTRRTLLDEYYGSYKLANADEATLVLDGKGGATYNGTEGYKYVADGNTLTLTKSSETITITLNLDAMTYVVDKVETAENPLVGTSWSDNGKISYDYEYYDEYTTYICTINLKFDTDSLCTISFSEEESYSSSGEDTIISEKQVAYEFDGTTVTIDTTTDRNTKVTIKLELSSDGTKLTFLSNVSASEVKGQSLTKAA